MIMQQTAGLVNAQAGARVKPSDMDHYGNSNMLVAAF